MRGIADFLDTILGGIDLIAFCLVVGGVLWALLLLRPWKNDKPHNEILMNACIQIILKSAASLLLIQVLILAVKAWVIAETLEQWPFPAFADTVQFKAGLIRTLSILCFTIFTTTRLRNHPRSRKYWKITAILMVPIIVSGAWLVHGAGRFEDRVLLMSVTVIHQIAAALWVGGIAQFMTLWRLQRTNPVIEQHWPKLLTRFSAVGISAVVVILITGSLTGWLYIGTIKGLLGTGYGNLLMVKLGLIAMALGFAGLNFRAAHGYDPAGSDSRITSSVPYYIQAEFMILITVLFTAAALSSQPPSADIPDLTASFSEIANVFKPRLPKMVSPSHQALLAGEAGRNAIVDQVSSTAAAAWSDYNHNVSGLFLFVMAIIGMLSYTSRLRWAQYWPLGFVALAIFLFFRADAEAWPMGPVGFWDSMSSNSEILQHRIVTLVTLALGIFEYQARKENHRHSWLPYVFPVLSTFGGLMLLTHSHVGFQAKTEFLIQIGHTLMGLLSIVVACGRLLELKLEPPAGRLAGFISVLGIFLISLILMFYREPLV